MLARVDLLRQPSRDVERFGARIVRAGIENISRIELAVIDSEHRRRRIERREAGQQVRRRSREIRLRQHEPVGKRHLLCRDRLAVERGRAVDRIDGRNHAAEHETPRDCGIGHQRLQDRRRIREPARLNHDAFERGNLAPVAAAEQLSERLREIAAQLAAQTAGRELDKTVVARLDELVIEADLAELVDDDGGARERGLAQQMAEQRRLAAAEEAGEHRDRDHDATGGVPAMRARLGA